MKVTVTNSIATDLDIKNRARGTVVNILLCLDQKTKVWKKRVPIQATLLARFLHP
jgi:hypothetical protein